MKSPFSIEVSHNTAAVTFEPAWNHRDHYQALFNAFFEIIDELKERCEHWALLVDWGDWMIQVPQDEMICQRNVHRFVDAGMAYSAYVLPDDPIARWQSHKIYKASPEAVLGIHADRSQAEHWLRELGFNLHYVHKPFKPRWLNPDPRFEHIVEELSLSKEAFVHH